LIAKLGHKKLETSLYRITCRYLKPYSRGPRTSVTDRRTDTQMDGRNERQQVRRFNMFCAKKSPQRHRRSVSLWADMQNAKFWHAKLRFVNGNHFL